MEDMCIVVKGKESLLDEFELQRKDSRKTLKTLT